MIFRTTIKNFVFAAVLAASPSLAMAASDELVRISITGLVDFDVKRQSLGPEEHIYFDFSEGLLTFDQEGQLIGGNADTWEVKDGGLHYIFHIRDNAKWSNGDPITAHDFVRSVKDRLPQNRDGTVPTYDLIGTIAGVRAYLSGETDDIDTIGIEALDDQHLSLRFTDVSLYQLNELSTDALLPLHEDWRDYPPDGSQGFLPTSGAYYPVEFKAREVVVLQKNPYYYGADDVAIEKVTHLAYAGPEMLLSEDEEGIYGALLNGDLHVATEANSDVIEWFGKHHPEFLLETDYKSFSYLEYNFANPALADPEIRRALTQSLDRETLSNIARAIQLKEMDRWFLDDHGILPPSRIETDPRPYEEKRAEAQSILARKGYTQEAPLKLIMRIKNEDTSTALAQAIAGMWREIGVDLEQVKHDDVYKYYTEHLVVGDFDLALPAWNGITPDFGYFINMAHSDPAVSGAMNFGQYQNEAVDEALNRANQAKTVAARNDALVDAEKILVEDNGKVPMSRIVNYFLVSPEVSEMGEGRFGHYLTRQIRLGDGAVEEAKLAN